MRSGATVLILILLDVTRTLTSKGLLTHLPVAGDEIQTEDKLRRSSNPLNLTIMLMDSDSNAVIAIYETHPQAEAAVQALQEAGFDMTKLSVVGKDYHTEEQVVGYYNTGDRMKYWGTMGALWGGFWGLLFGAAFFWVPGLGPLLVAGPLSASIVAALESAVVIGGLSALGAGLYSIGIPKDSIIRYESELQADKYLVIAHGTADEVAQAREILNKSNPAQLDDHVLKAAGQVVAN